MPLDIDLSADDESKRSNSLKTINKIIETGEKINCVYYIVHLEPVFGQKSPVKEIKPEKYDLFLKNTKKNLDIIFNRFPIKKKLLVENTGYKIDILNPFLYEYGLGLCLDIGHLAFQKENITKIIKHYAGKIKLVHLHGIDPAGHDHKGIDHYKKIELKKILSSLLQAKADFWVIEVFDEQSFFNSLNLLKIIKL